MEMMRAAADREAAGVDVVHMEVGQPSTPAPAGARAAAKAAIDNDVLGYTSAVGIEPLRTRLVQHYADWYGHDTDADRIIVTQGASGAFTLAFLACFEAGDRVAVTAPGYPCYRNTLEALDIEVVEIAVTPESGFRLTADMVESASALDGLVVASPANPTGTMLMADELGRLARRCHGVGVRLISDEIYHGISYGTPAATAAASSPSAVVVNSFSKYFSMTGWRLGWLLLPPDLVSPVERLAQNATIAAATVSQHAALGGFDSIDELEANVARYRTNRQILLDGLPAAGIDRIAPPDGAFYIYANVDHLTDDSADLAATWLAELGIATTPGIDFDPAEGHRYIRFSFAGSNDDMIRTVERLTAWAKQQQ
ncbi:MAG: aminotransferase class I/II-fold pyridoxal phosphate-dependent enzyme [Acidimicrobiales bacterium]|nr:aminotransferase class I/II-fold pyridoxal phosphate-dependent enzyme [Acidimicrobiales bacterium]MXX43672.1 aminotransferase class I/II-fold pyridoxal phosphate-dependent enzyme [Acidimicrobiales bacterium]MYB82235.1 aminotransferase class I/II-fold pyridoxal phosphate-dependent enzyme [Acidimicrobiales bacterium]MYD33705.1 aminotransferase class I/II-fold pyridoxal phosphate-dependent enzyme [Acidimicrobiales bacterium]MYI09766.1 aminotransferase class I/II-fold pyridoxal phosphate-depende